MQLLKIVLQKYVAMGIKIANAPVTNFYTEVFKLRCVPYLFNFPHPVIQPVKCE